MIALAEGVPLKAGPVPGVVAQAVYALETGDLVALSVQKSASNADFLAFAAQAWLVDEDGDAQAVAGVPILRTFTHSADVSQLGALGVQGIADALRDLLLGEPTAIRWGVGLRGSVSIRTAIALAKAAGTPIDWRAER